MDAFGCGKDHDVGTELYDLLEDNLDIAAGGEGVDAVKMAIVADYVQGCLLYTSRCV